MAHHASQHQGTRGGRFPRPRPARVLIFVVFGALVLMLAAPIWYKGGFATAEVEDTVVDAGEPVSNELFTAQFHSAELLPVEGAEPPRATLRLHADLTLRAQEAERASTLDQLMTVALEPDAGEPETFDTLRLERRPEQLAFWVQPAVTETVFLDWSLPEAAGSANDVAEQADQVRLTVLEAEYAPGFADQTERWRTTLDEDEVAQVVLPIGGE